MFNMTFCSITGSIQIFDYLL